MASVSHNRKTGRPLVQFTDADGKRQTVRLGAVTAKLAAYFGENHLDEVTAADRDGKGQYGAESRWAGTGGSGLLRGRTK